MTLNFQSLNEEIITLLKLENSGGVIKWNEDTGPSKRNGIKNSNAKNV